MSTMKLRRNEDGIVAIFSVLIVMGILTLLMIGFSNVARQAQRRTLNDQLNTQAYYAAESGINIAVANLDLDDDVSKTDCQTGAGFSSADYQIDDDYSIGISCLLIDSSPPTLRYDNVPVDVSEADPVAARIENAVNSNITEITFTWDSRDTSDTLPNSTQADLLPAAEWGSRVGILRVDLVPMGLLSRDALVSGTRTFYLYPTSSAITYNGSVNAGPDNHGRFVMTQCSGAAGAPRCSAAINLGAANLSRGYYARMYAYYNAVQVEIDAVDANGNDVNFINDQAVIDSTGRANDIFRRIQAVVPLNPDAGYNTGVHEIFALLGGDGICKRLVVGPGITQTVPPPTPDASEASCSIGN